LKELGKLGGGKNLVFKIGRNRVSGQDMHKPDRFSQASDVLLFHLVSEHRPDPQNCPSAWKTIEDSGAKMILLMGNLDSGPANERENRGDCQ